MDGLGRNELEKGEHERWLMSLKPCNHGGRNQQQQNTIYKKCNDCI